MPVYQGETYLPAQIESILEQTYPHFRLYIRDDGSTDSTLKIVQEYAQEDTRIVLITDNVGRLGTTGSIKVLLEKVRENVVFFADQDDVWAYRKIQIMLGKIPDDGLSEVPVVVFSDLEVVDRDMNMISSSFWNISGIDPSRLKFYDIISRNCVTGCAAAINRSMLELIRKMPGSAVHDWWAGCLAAHVGVLIPIPERLVQYRQHDQNAIGARERGMSRIIKLGKNPLFREKYLKQLQNSIIHLKAMLNCAQFEMSFFKKQALRMEIIKRSSLLFLLKQCSTFDLRSS